MVGYLIAFVAGVVAANGVPHYVKGVTGARHQTPFGRPSGAVLNVLWGAANFLGAAWLGAWAASFGLSVPWAVTAGIVGGAIAATGLAINWRGDPVARGEKDAE